MQGAARSFPLARKISMALPIDSGHLQLQPCIQLLLLTCYPTPQATGLRRYAMPLGTLDIMKLEGQPLTYQIMFEQNPGGTFVARVDSAGLVTFLHEEMRVELPVAESAAQSAGKDGRVRVQGVFLEENNLHAVMDYLEEDI